MPLPQGEAESEACALGVCELLLQALREPPPLVEREMLGEEVTLRVRCALRESAAVAEVERLPEGEAEALPPGREGVAMELPDTLSVLDAEAQALAEGQGEGVGAALLAVAPRGGEGVAEVLVLKEGRGEAEARGEGVRDL